LIPDDKDEAADSESAAPTSEVDAAAAARANPPSVIQEPAAPRRSHMPGMLNRFRAPLGRRTPGPGTVPAAKQALPANTGGVDLEDDHVPAHRPRSITGNCGVSHGLLDGSCVAHNFFACVYFLTSPYCPKRAKVKTPGTLRCSSKYSAPVDYGRPCRF
jgi:hypothetical protein